MNYLLRPLFVFLFCLLSTLSFSQYILNGSAKQISCNCYTLTPEQTFQSGSVWNKNKIDLTSSFDFWFNVFLGCTDANGADGIVFILQPISTSIGSSGAGMGFEGITPSIGIALDTWQNTVVNDPAYDHISIQANGIINHNADLAGPMPISDTSNNVEDCKWHVLRISWDASTKWLKTYFDGKPRVQKQIDLVSSIFKNDPNVYWGFSGATGGSFNVQQFCTSLNPIFTTNLPSNAGCVPASVQFADQSESFAPIVSYHWDFGDGGTSILSNPQHTYTQAGNYAVRLKITGLDGCENDSAQTVIVGSVPNASLAVFDTCFLDTPRIQFQSTGVGLQYQWQLDGTAFNQQPLLNNLPVGNHTIQVVARSQYNCGVPVTETQNFRVKPLPSIAITNTQACKDFAFSGNQTDSSTTIDHWNWAFGDGGHSFQQNPAYTYVQFGMYTVQSWADANGCSSDTATATVQITKPFSFAGHDTTVMRNKPFPLNGAGNGSFKWYPSFGLSNDTIANPIAVLPADQTYRLSVSTSNGCRADSYIEIRAIDGPQVYVANGFTPNNDGLNDVLRPVYVGISKLEYFSIYDRWGQIIFTTSDMSKGWNGIIKEKVPATGTFIWMVKAIDYLNQPVFLKGTVTVIH